MRSPTPSRNRQRARRRGKSKLKAEILILGSGTSMGVPTLGCECAVCTSTDPHNTRTRPSIAVEWSGHTVVIDTGEDFREQALREHIRHIDAVLYTHPHADHILGLDDLRPLSFHHPGGIPLYADDATAAVLRSVFAYTFAPTAKYPTRARVNLLPLNGLESMEISGLRFQRVPIQHGRITVSGYRFENTAYLTDMNAIPDASLPLLSGLDTLIIDALRPQPHPSHNNIEQALHWIEVLAPRRAWFTHIAHEIDHATVERQLPAHVHLAYDGLRIPIEI